MTEEELPGLVPGFSYLLNVRFWPKAAPQAIDSLKRSEPAATGPKQPVAGSEKSIPI
jgi:hypothetical protein